jgi:hypothetical protein
MAAPQRLVQAVQAGIVASAHMTALQHVSAAAQACQRLGQLTSGRWRSASRDLEGLENKLETAFSSAAEELSGRAEELGVPEDALWAVGDAAATLDLLRESAIDGLSDSDPRARAILEGEVLLGVSFVEDPDLPDRGTTILFAWAEPLSPASWPWQANWIAAADEDSDGAGDELDLFEAGEMEGFDVLLGDFADDLSCTREEAMAALRSAAMALTRASLLAATGQGDEDEEEEDDENDEPANGSA